MNFKINGIEWSIVEKTQKEIKEIHNQRKGKNEEKEDVDNLSLRYYGTTLSDELIIYLDKNLPEQRKRKTLIHELGHCYIDSYITHLERQYEEEDVADILANSFDIINEIVTKYFERSDSNEC